MYKSQFQKMFPYDWFCGPGSHVRINCTITRNVYLRYYTICVHTKFVEKYRFFRMFPTLTLNQFCRMAHGIQEKCDAGFFGCISRPLGIAYPVHALADPSHQRAGGNLHYFEQLLSKELRDRGQSQQEPADERPIQLDTYERPKDYLPEREVYEALCRGEGVKMVSAAYIPNTQWDNYLPFSLYCFWKPYFESFTVSCLRLWLYCTMLAKKFGIIRIFFMF